MATMAIWQFKFMLLPTEWTKTNADRIMLHLGDEGWDLGTAWRQCALREPPEVVIDQYMPRAQSWTSELMVWGDEETDDIQLWREAGEIDDLQIRIDARKNSDLMVQHSVSIARSLNCSALLMEEATIIDPTAEKLVSAMKTSTAMRFALDPIGTLEGLPTKRTPKFRSN